MDAEMKAARTYQLPGVIKRMAQNNCWPIAVKYHDDGRVEVECGRWGADGWIRFSEWFSADDVPEASLQTQALRALEQPASAGEGFNDWPEFHAQGMGCGLEDRGITDRYEAMRYGWDEALDAVAERIKNHETATPTPPATAQEDGRDAEIVGHKTFDDGHGGFRHEPLTRAEADVLIAHCKSEDERRKALMPDERSAIRMMMDAHTRLTDMGWKDPVYCPKDGSTFEVIEPGSTGIHKCIYMGEWPKGSWWALDGGDMYPSRPVLFRAIDAARGEGGQQPPA